MNFETTPPVPILKNSFEGKLRNHYGFDFWQSYNLSKNYRPQDILTAAELPSVAEIKPILEDATSVKLVEWRGGAEWRYVVSTSEERPDRKGKYKCQKVFKYEDKGWVQELTYIDPEDKTLPILDKFPAAIFDSMEFAVESQLGKEFVEALTKSEVLTTEQLNSFSHISGLKELIPDKAKVRYLRDVKINERNEHFPPEEEAVQRKMGNEFIEAYRESKKTAYSFHTQSEEVWKDLPLIDTLKKGVGWNKDYKFHLVKWKENGQEKYAYAAPVHTSKNGMDWDYVEVFTPTLMENGKESLSLQFLFYNPKQADAENKAENYFVFETEKAGKKLLQVLRPIENYEGDFENVFIGVSNQDGKTLSISGLYPEVSYISTIHRNKHRGNGAISYASNPVCYIARMEVEEGKSKWESFTKGNKGRLSMFGHELGHLGQHYQALTTSLEEARREINLWGKPLPFLYTTYVMPILLGEMITNLPNLSDGNFTSLYAGGALIAGNTIIDGDAWVKIEEGAEMESKLFIQASRALGIDLCNGIPDSQLPLFINSAVGQTVLHSLDLILNRKIRKA